MQNVFFNMVLGKISLVWLNAEMLVKPLFILLEESPNLFNSSIFNERFQVLQLMTMLRIVSHQKFCQKDARVESLFDTIINFSFFRVNQSVNFSWQLFQSWNKDWVYFLSQVNSSKIVNLKCLTAKLFCILYSTYRYTSIIY